jgi:hypothetical protein
MPITLDGTNGLSNVDGSASTPAIRGTDANTGIFFPAADTIAFAESGTEVMRIDSAGRLTKPYQPAFMAHTYSTSGPVIGNWVTTLFTTVVTNRGNHYNAGNGVYTCPIAGDYYVHCNMNLRASGANWHSAMILKNNSLVIQSWSQPNVDNQYENCVVNCVLNCAANDTIIFAFYSSYSLPATSANYNHASIYLLG